MTNRFVTLLYAPRSGSTFLAKELTNRYDIYFAPETNFVTTILKNYKEINNSNFEECLNEVLNEKKFLDWNISKEDIKNRISSLLPLKSNQLISNIISLYKEKTENSSPIGIKKGAYLNYYDLINQNFPDNKYIGLIRDGRSVFASQKLSIRSELQTPFETDPVEAAKAWVDITEKLRRIDNNNNNILLVKYEDLIGNFEQTIVKISEFLKIVKLSEPVNRYFLPERYNVLHKNVKFDPIQGNLDVWKKKLTENEILSFEKIARKTLISEGYIAKF